VSRSEVRRLGGVRGVGCRQAQFAAVRCFTGDRLRPTLETRTADSRQR